MDNQISENKEFRISKEMSDYELLEFVQAVEKNEMLIAPVYMKDNIMKRSNNPVIRIAAESKKVSKKIQLFWYSLKISAAVVIALSLLIFIGMPKDFIPQVKQEEIRKEFDFAEKLYQKSVQVTSSLENVSNKIIQ